MTPVNQDTADSTAVTLGTKFIPAADGYITGVRFYKGAGNTGTHTGTLYSATGSVLATGTFSNETATGWQMLNFPAAVPGHGRHHIHCRLLRAQRSLCCRLAASSRPTASTPDTSVRQEVRTSKWCLCDGQSLPGSELPGTNYYVDAVYNGWDSTPLTVSSTSPLAAPRPCQPPHH